MLLFNDHEKIVFTGDSVTDHGRARPVGEGLFDGVGSGYVRQIDTLLNVCYPERLIGVANTGISGHTSRDMLARWENDVLALGPDYVSLCIGFNDVWRQFDVPALFHAAVSPEEYRANLIAMIEMTVPRVKKMFLLTPYYVEANKQDPMRVRMDEYGAIVRELAAQYDLPLVDLQAAFDDYLQYRYPAYITWDRIHPGWIGSMLIAREFLRVAGFDRQVI